MKKDLLYPLRRFHGMLHEYPEYRRNRKEVLRGDVPRIQEQLKLHPDAVFLVMTPEHRNLGDHAIAAAESALLDDLGIPYIEIPDTQLNRLLRTGLLSVMDGCPIIINGGGNMGTLWFDAELTHRKVIKSNPNSHIFIFPNTIYYEDTEWGRKEFQNSIRIYNRHKHLHLYAREAHSYGIMRDAYRDVTLVPDIAFSMNESDRQSARRKGCLLCLRKDLERTRTPEQDQVILSQAERLFGDDITATDTLAETAVSAGRRMDALKQKYEELASSSLVITDRLHGMILCAITGTPCIVLNSRSPKVQGCYEWIRNLEYIRFVEDASQIAEAYHKIPLKKHTYTNAHLDSYFRKLKTDLLQTIRGGSAE